MSDAEQRFTEMYERHHGDVERYVRRRAPDVAVRDVVSEVFLVGWRRLAEVPDPSLPWLYGVARRVLANELRGRERGDRLRDRVLASGETLSEDQTERIADRLAMADAFDRLTEPDQEALRLVAWEQLSLRDAARAAGCTAPAFAMRLHRARRRLREALDSTAPTELVIQKGGR